MRVIMADHTRPSLTTVAMGCDQCSRIDLEPARRVFGHISGGLYLMHLLPLSQQKPATFVRIGIARRLFDPVEQRS